MKVKEFIACLALLVLPATSAIAQSIPASVEQRIRQFYAQKYPDNFSMQKTLIEDQLESYRDIQSWTSESGVPQDVFNKVKETYEGKYPYNYSMQKTLVQDQCESYRFLQSYTSVLGVPNTVLANLKQKYAQKYPYNFSMQKTLVQDQVKSYLELQRLIANNALHRTSQTRPVKVTLDTNSFRITSAVGTSHRKIYAVRTAE